MTFIPRTLSGLICAASLAFGLPALAAEKVNIGVVTGPTWVGESHGSVRSRVLVALPFLS